MRGIALALMLAGRTATTAAAEPPAASAQEAQEERWLAVTLDNDVIVRQDRHYTSGFQIAFPLGRNTLPTALRGSNDSDIVVALGQRIYTPTNITLASPDPADRPYAGWLYLLADMTTRSGHSIDHITASLGVIGPASLARGTQDLIHKVLNQVPPKGWDAQLKNEPALLLGCDRAWPALAAGTAGGQQWDFSPRVGITAGNVLTYASAGMVARLGQGLPADLAATRVSLGPAADSYRGAAGNAGWHVWLGAEARAVARNIFLDGNSGRDGPRVQREKFGYDALAGFATAWREWAGSFSVVRRSREFKGQASPDTFGQLTVSLAY